MKSMKTIQNGSVGVHTLFVKFWATKITLPHIKKAPENCFKTDLEHLLLELGNTNDCKEELSSLLCVETQKHRLKQLNVFDFEYEKFYYSWPRTFHACSRGQRLISINPVITEQNHREPPWESYARITAWMPIPISPIKSYWVCL